MAGDISGLLGTETITENDRDINCNGELSTVCRHGSPVVMHALMIITFMGIVVVVCHCASKGAGVETQIPLFTR